MLSSSTQFGAAVFQTAAEQNGCYASKSECDRLMHSEELLQEVANNTHLLGRQTLYCLSGLIVNAGPMLIPKRTNLLPTFWIYRLDAGSQVAVVRKPYSPNLDAGTLDFRMTMMLCI